MLFLPAELFHWSHSLHLYRGAGTGLAYRNTEDKLSNCTQKAKMGPATEPLLTPHSQVLQLYPLQ